MAIVFVPAPLRRLTDGRDRVEVHGATVGALVDAIDRAHPGFREQVVIDDELRPSLAVSVDGDLVTRGLDEPVGDASEVHFVPALGGGQEHPPSATPVHTSDVYRQTFETRGTPYNAAHALVPGARERERALLLDRLDLRAGLRVLDVPAGGGYVADGIRARGGAAAVVCVEPAAAFAAGIDPTFARVRGTLARLPFADASFDRVASLAGTHHLEDRAAFFADCHRVLRPGGRIAIADAACESAVARFLNGPVDRFSTTGHAGRFFSPGEAAEALRRAGFSDAHEEAVAYAWSFPSRETLVRYCTLLFGMERARDGEVARALDDHFAITVDADGRAHLPWSLVYATGVGA